MTFEPAPSGRTVLCHLHRQVPLVVQQELYFDSEWRELPCVYILSSGGPNLGGDRFRQRIELRRGAVAHISTGAATKVAEMPRDYSSVDTLLTLSDNAYLEWLPEPTILCRHARLHTTTRMVVAPSATLFYSEIFKCFGLIYLNTMIYCTNLYCRRSYNSFSSYRFIRLSKHCRYLVLGFKQCLEGSNRIIGCTHKNYFHTILPYFFTLSI